MQLSFREDARACRRGVLNPSSRICSAAEGSRRIGRRLGRRGGHEPDILGRNARCREHTLDVDCPSQDGVVGGLGPARGIAAAGAAKARLAGGRDAAAVAADMRSLLRPVGRARMHRAAGRAVDAAARRGERPRTQQRKHHDQSAGASAGRHREPAYNALGHGATDRTRSPPSARYGTSRTRRGPTYRSVAVECRPR
jgi:hypothetical protein